MRVIASIILSFLLVWSSTCQSLGYSLVGPLSKAALACLATENILPNQNHPFIIVRAYKVSGIPGIDPNAAPTFSNVKAANPNYALLSYIELCRNTDYVQQAIDIFQAINSLPYEFIFLKVEPNHTPGCSWDGYSQTDNCIFLTGLYQKLSQLTATISQMSILGVFSTANIWQKFFGTTCNGFGQVSIPLWYAHYHSDGQVDSTKSFDDFVPFGGWTAPYFKQVSGNQTLSLCNTPNWHADVDTVWTLF